MSLLSKQHSMGVLMSKNFFNIIAFFMCIFLFACGETPEKARKELSSMGISYTEESFADRVIQGDIVATKLFLTSGMSPNVKDVNGIGVLIWAISKNNTEIAKLLIIAGAKPDSVDNRCHISMVKDKVKGYPFLVFKITKSHTRQYYYFTPLMCSIINNNDGIAELLIGKPINLNETNGDSITALMVAASTGNIKILKVLLDKGANPNMKDNEGNTALEIVRGDGNKEIVSILERITAIK